MAPSSSISAAISIIKSDSRAIAAYKILVSTSNNSNIPLSTLLEWFHLQEICPRLVTEQDVRDLLISVANIPMKTNENDIFITESHFFVLLSEVAVMAFSKQPYCDLYVTESEKIRGILARIKVFDLGLEKITPNDASIGTSDIMVNKDQPITESLGYALLHKKQDRVIARYSTSPENKRFEWPEDSLASLRSEDDDDIEVTATEDFGTRLIETKQLHAIEAAGIHYNSFHKTEWSEEQLLDMRRDEPDVTQVESEILDREDLDTGMYVRKFQHALEHVQDKIEDSASGDLLERKYIHALSHSHNSPRRIGCAGTVESPPPIYNKSELVSNHKSDYSRISSTDAVELLLPIFEHYCSFGDPSNHSSLSDAKFMKFLRECGLIKSRITPVDIDLIFQTVTRGDNGSGKLSRLDFPSFCEALTIISSKMYCPDGINTHASDCLQRLLLENILPNSQISGSKGRPLLDSTLLSCLLIASSPLKQIFNHYAVDGVLHSDSFFRFCCKSNIVPTFATRADCAVVFQYVASSTSEGQSVMYDSSFLESLCFMAMIAYENHRSSSPNKTDDCHFSMTLKRMLLSIYESSMSSGANMSSAYKDESAIARCIASLDSVSLSSTESTSGSGITSNSLKTSHDTAHLADITALSNPISMLASQLDWSTNLISLPLLPVFEEYCSRGGEVDNISRLSRVKFDRFLNDCHVPNHASIITVSDIDNEFTRVAVRLFGSCTTGCRITFDGFCEILLRLSVIQYIDQHEWNMTVAHINNIEDLLNESNMSLTPLSALSLFINEQILPHMQALLDRCAQFKDRLDSVINISGIERACAVLSVSSTSNVLAIIFESYCDRAIMTNGHQSMSLKYFLKFARDYGLSTIVSMTYLCRLFHQNCLRSRGDVISVDVNLFHRLLACVGLFIFGTTSVYEQQYPNPEDKIRALLLQMERSNAFQKCRSVNQSKRGHMSLISPIHSLPDADGKLVSKSLKSSGLSHSNTSSTPQFFYESSQNLRVAQKQRFLSVVGDVCSGIFQEKLKICAVIFGMYSRCSFFGEIAGISQKELIDLCRDFNLLNSEIKELQVSSCFEKCIPEGETKLTFLPFLNAVMGLADCSKSALSNAASSMKNNGSSLIYFLTILGDSSHFLDLLSSFTSAHRVYDIPSPCLYDGDAVDALESALAHDLLQVYSYYSTNSFGLKCSVRSVGDQYMASGHITNFAFNRFLKAYSIVPGSIDRAAADIIFAKAFSSGTSHDSTGSTSRLSFQQFLVALSLIAEMIYAKSCDYGLSGSPRQYLILLILFDILPISARIHSDTRSNNETSSSIDLIEGVKALMLSNKSQFQQIYSAYVKNGNTNNNRSVGFSESVMQRLTEDFGICPDILTKREIAAIFSNSIVDKLELDKSSSTLLLSFDEFVLALVNCAMIGMSKPNVSDEIYVSIIDKINDLLTVMERSNGISKMSNLTGRTHSKGNFFIKIGNSTSVDILKLSQKNQIKESSSASSFSFYGENEGIARRVFSRYCRLGDVLNSGDLLSCTNFIKFMKESGLYDEGFKSTDAELLFSRVANEGVLSSKGYNRRISFTQWSSALRYLSAAHSTLCAEDGAEEEIFKKFLETFITPLDICTSNASMNMDPSLLLSTMVECKKHRSMLERVFFSALYGPGSPFVSSKLLSSVLSLQSFSKLMYACNIRPGLVSSSDIAVAFASASVSLSVNSFDTRKDKVDFQGFLEVLCRLALIGHGKPEFANYNISADDALRNIILKIETSTYWSQLCASQGRKDIKADPGKKIKSSENNESNSYSKKERNKHIKHSLDHTNIKKTPNQTDGWISNFQSQVAAVAASSTHQESYSLSSSSSLASSRYQEAENGIQSLFILVAGHLENQLTLSSFLYVCFNIGFLDTTVSFKEANYVYKKATNSLGRKNISTDDELIMSYQLFIDAIIQLQNIRRISSKSESLVSAWFDSIQSKTLLSGRELQTDAMILMVFHPSVISIWIENETFLRALFLNVGEFIPLLGNIYITQQGLLSFLTLFEIVPQGVSSVSIVNDIAIPLSGPNAIKNNSTDDNIGIYLNFSSFLILLCRISLTAWKDNISVCDRIYLLLGVIVASPIAQTLVQEGIFHRNDISKLTRVSAADSMKNNSENHESFVNDSQLSCQLLETIKCYLSNCETHEGYTIPQIRKRFDELTTYYSREGSGGAVKGLSLSIFTKLVRDIDFSLGREPSAAIQTDASLEYKRVAGTGKLNMDGLLDALCRLALKKFASQGDRMACLRLLAERLIRLLDQAHDYVTNDGLMFSNDANQIYDKYSTLFHDMFLSVADDDQSFISLKMVYQTLSQYDIFPSIISKVQVERHFSRIIGSISVNGVISFNQYLRLLRSLIAVTAESTKAVQSDQGKSMVTATAVHRWINVILGSKVGQLWSSRNGIGNDNDSLKINCYNAAQGRVKHLTEKLYMNLLNRFELAAGVDLRLNSASFTLLIRRLLHSNTDIVSMTDDDILNIFNVVVKDAYPCKIEADEFLVATVMVALTIAPKGDPNETLGKMLWMDEDTDIKSSFGKALSPLPPAPPVPPPSVASSVVYRLDSIQFPMIDQVLNIMTGSYKMEIVSIMEYVRSDIAIINYDSLLQLYNILNLETFVSYDRFLSAFNRTFSESSSVDLSLHDVALLLSTVATISIPMVAPSSDGLSTMDIATMFLKKLGFLSESAAVSNSIDVSTTPANIREPDSLLPDSAIYISNKDMELVSASFEMIRNGNNKAVSTSSIAKFTRDCGLIDSRLPTSKVDIVIAKVLQMRKRVLNSSFPVSGTATVGKGLDLQGFISVVGMIARAKFPREQPQNALANTLLIIKNYVDSRKKEARALSEPITLESVQEPLSVSPLTGGVVDYDRDDLTLDPDISQELLLFSASLFDVYLAFSNERPPQGTDLIDGHGTLSDYGWASLCKHYRITPVFISSVKTTQAFRRWSSAGLLDFASMQRALCEVAINGYDMIHSPGEKLRNGHRLHTFFIKIMNLSTVK